MKEHLTSGLSALYRSIYPRVLVKSFIQIFTPAYSEGGSNWPIRMEHIDKCIKQTSDIHE